MEGRQGERQEAQAVDVVMREPVAFKGAVLTQLSAFWFRTLRHVVPNHCITADAATQRLRGSGRKNYSLNCEIRRRITPYQVGRQRAAFNGPEAVGRYANSTQAKAWSGALPTFFASE